ncbi:C40 family peptidase [Shimia biformata]|uniref:C40 family peptidase n=1 Tax=Shimia biformata TaxID=1294299 RepID=UPI0019502C19|nr:NlpC/P60 family protein [Shimia biformata]
MDRRVLASNGRVAHTSLRGKVDADRFSDGQSMRVCEQVTPLLSIAGATPQRERELILHERFRVLETLDGLSFGFAERDGYVGFVRSKALGPVGATPTHVVAARQSYLVASPRLKNSDDMTAISFGTELAVAGTHENGRWAEVTVLQNSIAESTKYLPSAHLRPLDSPESDPVSVAERFIGTPYHWGGNSGFGIDCSGLVQAACLACGVPCPGDSDMQEQALGASLPADAPLQRGDLLFWKGHVAWVVDANTILHANAFHMSVAYEGLQVAIARIARQGDGDITSRNRLAR